VIHKLLVGASRSLSIEVRVKRMFAPSGEMAGFPTDSKSMKVSLEIRSVGAATQTWRAIKTTKSEVAFMQANFDAGGMLSCPPPDGGDRWAVQERAG
jgi:hypothetical protein